MEHICPRDARLPETINIILDLYIHALPNMQEKGERAMLDGK